MITTNQKPVTDTHKIDRKPNIILKKVINHKAKEQKKGTEKKYKNDKETSNKRQ